MIYSLHVKYPNGQLVLKPFESVQGAKQHVLNLQEEFELATIKYTENNYPYGDIIAWADYSGEWVEVRRYAKYKVGTLYGYPYIDVLGHWYKHTRCIQQA